VEIEASTTITLHESYTSHVGLDRRSGEPTSWINPESLGSDSYDELVAILTKHGAVVERHLESLPRTHGPKHFDGGHDTLVAINALITFVSGAPGLSLAALVPALLGWLKYRSSRSVTIKSGDTTVTLKGSDDLEKAIEAVERIKGRSNQRTAAAKKGSKKS